jgi:hypothetical protein
MSTFHCNCGVTITGTKRDIAAHLAECITIRTRAQERRYAQTHELTTPACPDCGHSVSIHTEGGVSGFTCSAGDCYCATKASEIERLLEPDDGPDGDPDCYCGPVCHCGDGPEDGAHYDEFDHPYLPSPFTLRS